MRHPNIVVFLGPSLSLARARKVLRAHYLPPARQGDVFKVLPSRPHVIVLIDGVFEAVPSVWHHELRAALACGVYVLGAASMGALRAAELHHEGMVPVGKIAGEYLQGTRVDDADVAVLHGPSDRAAPITLPLVNAQATIELASRRRVLSTREASQLRERAEKTFFKERTWRALLASMPWNGARRDIVSAWVKLHAVDQKADDAELALRVAKRFATRPRPEVRTIQLSSFVRRRRLIDAYGEKLERLSRRRDANELAAQGLRRLLIAEFARIAGLEASAVSPLPVPGLAADEALSNAQVVALEKLVLSAPERFVSDGPSWLEGLALEARLRGCW